MTILDMARLWLACETLDQAIGGKRTAWNVKNRFLRRAVPEFSSPADRPNQVHKNDGITLSAPSARTPGFQRVTSTTRQDAGHPQQREW